MPAYGEVCGIEVFDRFRLADNCGYRFPAIAGLVVRVRKHGLVGEAGNHAVAIVAGNVFGGKNRFHSGMRRDEGWQIAEAKPGPIKRAADDAQREGIYWDFIGAVNLRAFDLVLSIQANQALTDGCARCGVCWFSTLQMPVAARRIEDRVDNLPVSGAAAEHSTQGILYFGLGR